MYVKIDFKFIFTYVRKMYSSCALKRYREKLPDKQINTQQSKELQTNLEKMMAERNRQDTFFADAYTEKRTDASLNTASEKPLQK